MALRALPFTHAYDETLEMIVEARNYVAYAGPRQRVAGKEGMGLKFCCEALRVTSRLTQVMAWLMVQRAAEDGEISIEEACREDNRLSGHGVCLDTSADEDQTLPEGLRSLLDRSYRLYRRVSRLEEMILAHRSLNDNVAAR
jgi:regulator of CtrA degradation